MADALEELGAASLTDRVFLDLNLQGRTARGLARPAAPRDFDPDAWVQRVLELYIDRFDEKLAEQWRLAEDAEPALRQLLLDGFRLAFVTGLPEAIARFRLERLGIGRCFPAGTGAFGCEADDRADQLRLALWRSACLPRNVVQISGAPCALRPGRELGLWSVVVGAVADDADLSISSLADLPYALRVLRPAA